MQFKYNALNKEGKSESGIIEADGESAAKNEMKTRGLYLVSLKEVLKRQERRKELFSFGLKQRLPIQLATQLASLLKGGVPLYQALTIITNQLDSEKAKEIVDYLRDQVRGGMALSQALKAYPRIFDDLFVYSIQAGERSGALDSILAYQADLLENRAAVKGRIKTALVYPIIMVTVGLGVLVFLMTYVVPMVTKIFERMNQGLPLPTQLLIGTANFLNNYGVLLLGAIIAAGIAGSRWMRKSQTAMGLRDRLMLRLPLFGNLYNMILTGRFTRIMATLLKSGVTMVQALMVVSNTMKNRVVSEHIMKIAEMVEGGTDLSSALRTTGAFPSYVADMVSVGESSGNLEEMLARVSDYYELNVSQKIAAFTSAVEPVIILAMGVVVAFVLVSILLPLFEMNKILIKR
jgi:general secretion pathway protein F